MGFLELASVGEDEVVFEAFETGPVAAFVGGLRFEAAAESGVGGNAVVLWCRRLWREDDVHDVIVRGARKSRTGAWLRDIVLGERIREAMATTVGGIVGVVVSAGQPCES